MSRVTPEPRVRARVTAGTIATGGRNPRLPWYHAADSPVTTASACSGVCATKPVERSSHNVPESASRQASHTQRFRTSRSMRRVGLDDTRQAFTRALDHNRQARGLVDFHHLPGKAGAQIALRTVHDAEQRRHVVRQLGAAAVPGWVDVAEVVLEADSGDDGDHGTHDAREDGAIVVARRIVGDQERAAIEKQPARARPAADDAERIGRVAVLGPRLRQIVGASLHMRQCRRRRIPPRERHRTGDTVRAPRDVSSSRSRPPLARAAVATPQGRDPRRRTSPRCCRCCAGRRRTMSLASIEHPLRRKQLAHAGVVGHLRESPRVRSAPSAAARPAVVRRLVGVVEADRSVPDHQHQRVTGDRERQYRRARVGRCRPSPAR